MDALVKFTGATGATPQSASEIPVSAANPLPISGVGATGPSGATGATGASGSTGPQGLPGSTVTPIAAGSSISLTDVEGSATVKLDTASGSTVSLPAATGTGTIYYLTNTVIPTSNAHVIKTVPSSDIFIGTIGAFIATIGYQAWTAAADSNTITLDGAGLGASQIGDALMLTDVATGKWLVTGLVNQTSIGHATPFSHV